MTFPQTKEQFRLSERWLMLALFILTVLSRIPFRSEYLYHTDSVNMAFGILKFNVLQSAPHFPGYIVYIALAQALNFLIDDPQTTMIIISIISSGLAVTMLYFLGRDMFNPLAGLIAAIFLATSPLYWFYGEIALPHSMDTFVTILAVWLLYKIMQGETGWLWWTAVYLGFVGGFRQQTLLFLVPLMILAGHRLGLLRIILAGILIAITTLIWFLPLMAYSGGIRAYMEGSKAFSDYFLETTSLLSGAGWPGLRRNLTKLTIYTLYGWSLALIPALYWFWQVPRNWRQWLTNRKFWFILIWIAPSLMFYAFIHMGQQGLVFVFLPALMLISAEGIRRLFENHSERLRVVTAVIGLIGAGIFILGPMYPLGEDRPEIKLLSYSTLRDNDWFIGNRVNAVREHFDPRTSLLLTSIHWHHLEYYLPDYHYARILFGSKWEVDEGQLGIVDYFNEPMTPIQIGLETDVDWQVVITDSNLNASSTDPLEIITLPNGFQMAYLPLESDQAFLNRGIEFGRLRGDTIIAPQ